MVTEHLRNSDANSKLCGERPVEEELEQLGGALGRGELGLALLLVGALDEQDDDQRDDETAPLFAVNAAASAQRARALMRLIRDGYVIHKNKKYIR